MTDGPSTSISPPASPAPAPSPRYDRQIRIWGDHGQAALSRSSICLLNAGPTGTETLKNLVLPGIASFLIVDPSDTTPTDPAANFFLPASPPALNRAHLAARAMHELNPAVHASYIPHALSSFIRTVPDARRFFARFSAVIATQLAPADPLLQRVAAGCYAANVPLLLVRAAGLVGYLRLQARELPILHAHHDHHPPDLRLHAPFPALRRYVSALNLPAITDSTHLVHVPFVAILAHAAAIFQHRNHGALPVSRADKRQFADIVAAIKPPACPVFADNFDEALKPSNMRLCHADAANLPTPTHALFTDPKSDPNTDFGLKPEPRPAPPDAPHSFPEVVRFLNRPPRSAHPHQQPHPHHPADPPDDKDGAARIADDNRSFWLHVAAIRDFWQESGCLPLQGSLPDMTADTESYIHLQKLYSTKADADAKVVAKLVANIAERHAVDDVDFDDESVRRFCKNAVNLRVYRTRSIVEEMESKDQGGFKAAADMDGALDASRSGSPAAFYALFRAADRFRLEHGREAGSEPGMVETDIGLMYEYLSSVKEEVGVTAVPSLWRDEAAEMVRYAGTEVHNVCAFMGGIAAQEVTKILTRQFMPLDNTLVVNFAEQSSVAFAA